ncbi:SIMPL domain-containing protein [Taylorella equigenitalis]|uniref:Putative exported protein n=1 Tax=Taylorella equigenitalis (strain MCE9) TaxID=937774 RepID=A0A654KHN5_TAYEM|nr:SIMPL domain-containing protein [Taylorella equigenitalis]ADU91922.1 putative exported protein [Taylorella equigenitalis MCE9]ASY30139.1 SIMPL domain-containing protein [Taylorella equigenitalis]ASY41868.1 SIMPL domain-containing protein [Taylorella equigenitalis]KOS58629.1 hypothetical protein AM589_05595 [Taylorella equigenitalis]RBA25935.1 DUF541 domain-containing protein [Taylorella equigenitalis]
MTKRHFSILALALSTVAFAPLYAQETQTAPAVPETAESNSAPATTQAFPNQNLAAPNQAQDSIKDNSKTTTMDDSKNDVKSARFTISSSVHKKVKADFIELTLRTEKGGEKLEEMTAEVNNAMKKVLELSKDFPELQVSTNNFNFWKEYPHYGSSSLSKNEIIWNVQGSVSVAGGDFKKIEEFIKATNNIMIPDNMNFSLSQSARKAAEAEILQQAADEFKDKADRVIKAFGYTSYTIGSVGMDGNIPDYFTNGNFGRVVDAAMNFKEAGGLPVSPGSVDVSVSFTGEIFAK